MGVDAFDEECYRALLTRQAATPAELAVELSCSADRAVRSLTRLCDHGLVARLSGTRHRYAAIDPHYAVERLVRFRVGELDRVRDAAGELGRLFDVAQPGGSSAIEIVRGEEALGRWFVRLQQEARHEVRTLDRPPYALTTANPVEERALGKGVVYKAVYAPEAFEWPGTRAHIRGLVGQGEQARVLPGLRVKLAIADGSLALMPLSLDLTDVRAAIIRPSTLLDVLVDFWQSCWDQAAPLVPSPSDSPLTEDDKLLLSLLVSGLKDEAIARQLGWSVRTMRRRISRLHELLDATNRFQAGVTAARRGWL